MGIILPWQAGRRVALIVLPDQFDLSRWYHTCNEADERAGSYVADELSPGEWVRTEITYPQMRYVSGVSYIYLGWRGQLRSRHVGTHVRKLVAGNLPDADFYPEWVARYEPGGWYQWGFANLSLVSQYALPFDIMTKGSWNMWQPIIGVMSNLAPIDENPKWLRPGNEPGATV